MSNIKNNTLIYLMANILSACVPFLLIPVLTRSLSTFEYGQIAMFQVVVTCLTSIIGFNAVAAAMRKYYDNDFSENDYNLYISNCFFVLILSVIIVLSISIVLKDQIEYILGIPASWVYCAVFYSSCKFVLLLRLSQWQVRRKPKHYGFLQVTNSLCDMLLSLLFVIMAERGAFGRIEGQLISISIVGLTSLLLLYKDKLIGSFKIDNDYLHEIIKLGVPLLPHTLGIFLLGALDRVVISKTLGLSDAGIYMVAVQISMVASLIFDSLNKAFVPWLFEKLKLNDLETNREIVKVTYLFYFALSIIVILSFYISPSILLFIAGDDYVKASEVIGLLVLGQCLSGMYLTVTNYIFFAKNTALLSLITISCGFINALLLVWLTPIYGLKGAATSFCIAKAIQFFVTWLFANKSYKMPWLLYK
ncbi:lipopolysaccharide biosynthesis protein [Vibrio breoganii]|uniref:lipopolysaccharide biosynthesis protein n=1 Tax=Vibrio breoganii TaxID=553239 RepID=UPI000CBD7EDB|nr:oligosaccharide flippase family protein [Vibrio breoganii]PMG94683.1 hypothetical protein BCU79_01070 [Vibrio breoganii]PMK41100.1 hypothetical protein BCU00_01835 [Vibrio breoganii]